MLKSARNLYAARKYVIEAVGGYTALKNVGVGGVDEAHKVNIGRQGESRLGFIEGDYTSCEVSVISNSYMAGRVE
jgi:hypothetical protein